MSKDNKQELIRSVREKLKAARHTKQETKPLQVDDSVRSDYIKSMNRHLDALFEDFDGDLFIEIRGINGTPREFFENTASNREKIARKYALATDLCVGLNPRLTESGTKDAVLEARFLVVDFDRKDKEKPIGITHNEILEVLSKLKLKPRLIVFSGNGFHVYFKLDHPVNAIEFEDLQRRLIDYINNNVAFDNAFADKSVHDAPRIIRLVSTINSKNSQVTRIVHDDPNAVNSVEELRTLLPAQLAVKPNGYELNDLNEEQLDKILLAIKERFSPGQRQFLILGLAGVLAKKGVGEEEAVAIYKQHFGGVDDPHDHRMREACIRRTYKLYRNGQEIAGYSILQNFGVDLSFLKQSQNEAPDGDQLLKKLRIINSRELSELQFPKRPHVVENLIPSGLVIFAGKSKLGKSWFSLFLALHVATNTPLWGQFRVNTNKKFVYYFALEDHEERILTRKQKILANVRLNSPDDNLCFVLNSIDFAFRFNEDGFKILETLAKQSCLIIIDTYVRAKEPKYYRNEYEYESALLSRLQRIAFEHNTTLLLVHHTRKAYSEDVFDNVLGSTALMGVADAIIVFERMRKQDLVKIHITGRDVEEQSIALKFDMQHAIFTFEGDAELLELTELQKEALELLRKEALTFTELSNRLGKPKGTVYKILQKLLEEKLIREYNQGRRIIYIANR